MAFLMVLAVVVVIGGAYMFYTKVLVPETKSDFSTQSSAVQASIQSQASSFVSSLEACRAKTANACVCKNALINLPKEVSVKIVNKENDIAIDFLYNGKSFRNNTISNAFFSETFYDSEKIVYENIITFEDGKINGDKIISLDVYKKQSRLSAIAYKSKTLYLIGASEETQKAVFDKLASC
jgi:hypothetical protein